MELVFESIRVALTMVNISDGLMDENESALALWVGARALLLWAWGRQRSCSVGGGESALSLWVGIKELLLCGWGREGSCSVDVFICEKLKRRPEDLQKRQSNY